MILRFDAIMLGDGPMDPEQDRIFERGQVGPPLRSADAFDSDV
jgi:hypothetical protein